MIESCPEIRTWLNQFATHQEPTAIDLLLRLRFVSQTSFAEWLKETLNALPFEHCAIYSVRKLDKSIACYWDANGDAVSRPSASQGSEDLVQSVIANLLKANATKFLDHPSINELRGMRVHDFVLVDDSIGSGDRVCEFLQRMVAHKTFLSWWSLGIIRIHIVSLARTTQAETKIIETLPGSDHHTRKFKRSDKIKFVGLFAFNKDDLASRWGSSAEEISRLCDSIHKIPGLLARGWGETMANIVFYHSVPDNIPGILWDVGTGWTPLFPNRSVPEWLPRLLEGPKKPSTSQRVSPLLVATLQLIKSGLRKPASLATRTGVAPNHMAQLLDLAVKSGLITHKFRITEQGFRIAMTATPVDGGVLPFDRSLYIPKFWCAGQTTVQPSVSEEATSTEQTHPVSRLLIPGGEAGQASLERTDAMTASPSAGIVARGSSKSPKGNDTRGPLG